MPMERFSERTLVMLLSGGRGERLYPLTRDRAKPSVPFLGAYRMIDFSLSNCLNSGLRKIALLTQYKSLSLERHILFGWNIFHVESGGYVISLPAQGRVGERWYEGTADAVFQNIYSIQHENPERVLILSGDHVYKCDYRVIEDFRAARDAEAVVLAKPVPRAEGRRFGIIRVDRDGRIEEFIEKPKTPPGIPGREDFALASMGVYLFRTPVLVRALMKDAKTAGSSHDFGRDILPRLIRDQRIYVYPFDDYWEDIGTIDAYWLSNQAFLETPPPCDLFDAAWPIRTYQGQHPPTQIDGSVIRRSILGTGCRIRGADIRSSILSPGVEVGEGARLDGSIVFDGVRIGRKAGLHKTIVDKGAVIPDGFVVGLDEEADRRYFRIYGDGVRIIPRGWSLG